MPRTTSAAAPVAHPPCPPPAPLQPLCLGGQSVSGSGSTFAKRFNLLVPLLVSTWVLVLPDLLPLLYLERQEAWRELV